MIDPASLSLLNLDFLKKSIISSKSALVEKMIVILRDLYISFGEDLKGWKRLKTFVREMRFGRTGKGF